MRPRRYVYALLDAPLEKFRFHRRTIDTLEVGTIYAALSTLESPPRLSEGELSQQHEIVGALAARTRAILPMRFGTFVDDVALEQFVTTHQAALLRALDLVRDREQMTARLIGSQPRNSIGPRPAPIRGRSMTGTEYLRQRRELARPRPLPPEVAQIQCAVRGLALAERAEAGEGALRASLWHLIPRGQSTQYRHALRAVEHVIAPLRVVVSGPWAPFAFVPSFEP